MRFRVSALGAASLAAGTLVLGIGVVSLHGALTAVPPGGGTPRIATDALPALQMVDDEDPDRALGFEVVPTPGVTPTPDTTPSPRATPRRNAPAPAGPTRPQPTPAEQSPGEHTPEETPSPAPEPSTGDGSTPAPTTPAPEGGTGEGGDRPPAPPLLGTSPEGGADADDRGDAR
ncbi:hypothetical protein [Microbacterium sp. GXF7504]